MTQQTDNPSNAGGVETRTPAPVEGVSSNTVIGFRWTRCATTSLPVQVVVWHAPDEEF